MREQLVARAKSLLRPIKQMPLRLERRRYQGTTILFDQAGNDAVAASLTAGGPGALGKMGASELGGLRVYEQRKRANGICARWGRHRQRLNVNAGVFPDDDVTLSRFCQELARSLTDMTVLVAWYQRGEHNLIRRYAPTATLVGLTALEPYYYHRPWSAHLAGKRVLVISPFTDTIRAQYARREAVWQAKPEVLPAFDLDTLRCPLSAGLVPSTFPDWFAALQAMQDEMNRRTFDVLLVGAGAWSLPLVARAKQMGKWAIHLGGPTQLLFGIRGGRWDQSEFFQYIYNDAWVRPAESDRPSSFRRIENGCYW